MVLRLSLYYAETIGCTAGHRTLLCETLGEKTIKVQWAKIVKSDVT
jgi:hypothetical protein